MPTAGRITPDEEKFFIEEFIHSGSAWRAYKKMRPNCGDNTCKTNGNIILKRPSIQKLLEVRRKKLEEEFFEIPANVCRELGLDAKRIVTGLLKIAENPEAETSARVNAYKLLGLYRQLWGPSLSSKPEGPTQIFNVTEINYAILESRTNQHRDAIPLLAEKVPSSGIRRDGVGLQEDSDGVAPPLRQGQDLPEPLNEKSI